MRAGDIVYQHSSYPKKRGELIEFLCDAIEAALWPDYSSRQSEGQVADTLLRCLDVAVVTDEKRKRLVDWLEKNGRLD
tara:strand:- start:1756 stop:1989 length:234 start_codon:yes stop_codon:yes gene_type:complete